MISEASFTGIQLLNWLAIGHYFPWQEIVIHRQKHEDMKESVRILKSEIR